MGYAVSILRGGGLWDHFPSSQIIGDCCKISPLLCSLCVFVWRVFLNLFRTDDLRRTASTTIGSLRKKNRMAS
ncbi:hypothetical protein VTN00DRAFT_4459 [Thermoascus crustaceus]|uniref:uncharacterized protein n=1 Tax=Thermoascus crustaceus TaxID=5088 RepID=UPI003743C1C1